MNKVWEVIEREAREGSEHKGYRRGMRSMKHDDDMTYKGYKRDDVQEAYDCGFDDGYSEAMKKIFSIIREHD